jgi:hypothetical protein
LHINAFAAALSAAPLQFKSRQGNRKFGADDEKLPGWLSLSRQETNLAAE